MSKTALKILIESIELVEGTYNNEADSALGDVKKVAQSLLPKEKEIIMTAFVDGKRVIAANSVAKFVPKKNDDPEVYFNQTYK